MVLSCTHYPLLLPELEEAAPWPVRFIDPAEAIARQALRVADLAEAAEGGNHADEKNAETGHALLTAPAADWRLAELEQLFAREGFGEVGVVG